ncbi:MAG: 2-C-methyl-D-erythritol 4-phosphate cytidylyltransferase [Desulfobacteraceae bacterium]|nr:MAG: 2-C-methyl-D-erythritol 4-phosphate cytidylyltransferase [Desulfobacteraceae bacterium]
MKQEEENGGVRTLAVIPAAGAGVRMGSYRAKQFLDLGGRPLLAVTLQIFEYSSAIHEVNLVVPADEVEYCKREIVRKFGLEKVKRVVPGGNRRQDSVRLGLEASAGEGFEIAIVHDGVRPLVRPELIRKVAAAAQKERAVVAALPAKDTVKEVSEGRIVGRTHDRRRIWLVQTPQGFRFDDLLSAHRKALEQGWEEATDDALLMEKIGVAVHVIEGSEDNIKVTTPYDLELARFLLKRTRDEGRPLR